MSRQEPAGSPGANLPNSVASALIDEGVCAIPVKKTDECPNKSYKKVKISQKHTFHACVPKSSFGQNVKSIQRKMKELKKMRKEDPR